MSLNEKQIVLAKIKGFPDWPAVIIPESSIPENIKQIKPVSNDGAHHFCVRFYYDDQYSWVTSSSISPLPTENINAYLIKVGELGEDESFKKKAGRKKRITEAYLKCKCVPIDEFIQFGSWGPPAAAPEETALEENAAPESEITDENEYKRQSRNQRKSRHKKVEVYETAEQPKKRKYTKVVEQQKPAKVAKKRSSGRLNKKTETSPDLEELLVEDYNNRAGDEDYTSSVEEEEEEEEIEEDDVEEDDDDGDAEEEEDEESDNIDENIKPKNKRQKVEDVLVDEDEDEDEENEWLLPKQNDSEIQLDFGNVPNAAALAEEVSQMTEWCKNLRVELQALVFPLKKQKRGKVEVEPESEVKVEEVKEEPKAESDSKDAPDQLSENVKSEQNGVVEPSGELKDEELEAVGEAELEEPVDYKRLVKSIDELIEPLVTSDISKSAFRSSGLMKIVSVILRKPEFKSSMIKKLHDWWVRNFGYRIAKDEHWSDDFTIAMHLEEEKQRREREEEKKRKRREERKLLQIQSQSHSHSQSQLPTPTPDLDSPVSTPASATVTAV